MKVQRHFPVTDFLEVKHGEESIQVKFKFPSYAQARAIAEESSFGGRCIATCKYCIQEVQGIEDESGAVKIQAVDNRGSLELNDADALLLWNYGLAQAITVEYSLTVDRGAEDKKKLESSPQA